MKRSKTSARKVRQIGRKPLTRSSSQIRRRAAAFKLESLEERTLLSTGTKLLPPPPADPPGGLGSTYTTMSEQAHGVGLNSGANGQSSVSTTTSPPATMAELQSYLLQLGTELKNAN